MRRVFLLLLPPPSLSFSFFASCCFSAAPSSSTSFSGGGDCELSNLLLAPHLGNSNDDDDAATVLQAVSLLPRRALSLRPCPSVLCRVWRALTLTCCGCLYSSSCGGGVVSSGSALLTPQSCIGPVGHHTGGRQGQGGEGAGLRDQDRIRDQGGQQH